MKLFLDEKNAFLQSVSFSVCSARFLCQASCRVEGFASCLEEQRLLTPAPVTYSPLYKGRGEENIKKGRSGRLNVNV